MKGYKVLNLTTKKILVSRDVTFHEFIFPFSHQSDKGAGFPPISIPQNHVTIDSTWPDVLTGYGSENVPPEISVTEPTIMESSPPSHSQVHIDSAFMHLPQSQTPANSAPLPLLYLPLQDLEDLLEHTKFPHILMTLYIHLHNHNHTAHSLIPSLP